MIKKLWQYQQSPVDVRRAPTCGYVTVNLIRADKAKNNYPSVSIIDKKYLFIICFFPRFDQ